MPHIADISLSGLAAFAITGLLQVSPLLAAEADPSVDFKQSAQLTALTPSGKYVRRGRNTIEVEFNFRSIKTEAIEYVGILTINGSSYGPLTFVLTPGEITVKTNMRWGIRADVRKISARFRLIGIGNTSKTGYEFVDITKDYIAVTPTRHSKASCKCAKSPAVKKSRNVSRAPGV